MAPHRPSADLIRNSCRQKEAMREDFVVNLSGRPLHHVRFSLRPVSGRSLDHMISLRLVTRKPLGQIHISLKHVFFMCQRKETPLLDYAENREVTHVCQQHDALSRANADTCALFFVSGTRSYTASTHTVTRRGITLRSVKELQASSLAANTAVKDTRLRNTKWPQAAAGREQRSEARHDNTHFFPITD